MNESFLLAGYVGAVPSRRPDGMVGVVPDPYLTISNCLAEELLVPEFYGWFQDLEEALAAAREAHWPAPLLTVGIASRDAEILLAEYADEPYHFTLLRERRPLPPAGAIFGFEVVGIEYGLSFHSWHCHAYTEEVERELGVVVNSPGLMDSYPEAARVLSYMLTDADEHPAPVPWTVVMLAELVG